MLLGGGAAVTQRKVDGAFKRCRGSVDLWLLVDWPDMNAHYKGGLRWVVIGITTGLLLALACSSTPSVTVEEYGAMTDNEVTAHIQDCGEHWKDEVYGRTVSRVHEIYPGIELASRDEARFESRTNHTEGRLEVRVFIDQVGRNITYDGSIDIDLFNCGDPNFRIGR